MHTSTLTAAYGAILTAALAVTVARARRAEAATAERCAAAHAAGYRQGLMHAAAGLLDCPRPGTSTRVDTDERSDT